MEESKKSELMSAFCRDRVTADTGDGLPTRQVQYHNRSSDICNFVLYTKDKSIPNPCGCGSNCFHHEFDGSRVYCVCNSCKKDIYEVREEYIDEELATGVWK